MVSYVLLASAVVMGLLVAVVFAGIGWSRNWYDYRPQISPPERGVANVLANSVRVWIVGFVVLVVAVMGAVFLAIESGSLVGIYALFGLIVVGFLTFGVYATGRSLGHPHAHAVGEAILALATVLLLAITGNLLISFGA